MIKTFLAYFLLLFIVLPARSYSQENDKKDNYTYRIREEEGDLNNDKLKDIVIVDLKQKDETTPARLQIFFAQPNSKKFKLIVSTTKLIESQYPKEKGSEYSGDNIPDFLIEKGILQMVTDIKNRKSRYIFKYTNGNFELNSIERIFLVKNGITQETNINLLTGIKVEYDRGYSNKISNKRSKKIAIRTLPKVQNLTFSDLETY